MSAQPAPMNARRVMELLRNGLGAPLAPVSYTHLTLPTICSV